MSRESRRRIVEENIEIYVDGYYMFDNSKKNLKLNFEQRRAVDVFSPDRIEEIMKENSQPGFFYDVTTVEVKEGNSFEASYAMRDRSEAILVMSFANANVPGGGFLKGANAQEEVLCRQSTLYQSLSCQKASVMYESNLALADSDTDTDFMLISPNVEVFRRAGGDFLKESFVTSVLSLPAPNVRGRAAKLSGIQLSAERRNKLRKAFHVASRAGYDTLILGPWGCGAYGNEVLDVAADMRAVLIDEKMIHMFKHIVFAVHDTKPEKPNFTAFSEIFVEKTVHKDGTIYAEKDVLQAEHLSESMDAGRLTCENLQDAFDGGIDLPKKKIDDLPEFSDARRSEKRPLAEERNANKSFGVNGAVPASFLKPIFSDYPFPTVIWDRGEYSDLDLGYIRGSFSDRRYFFAELYRTDANSEICLNLVFSAKGFAYALESERAGDRFVNDVTHMLWKKSVLTKSFFVEYGGYGERFVQYQEEIMSYLQNEGIIRFLNPSKREFQMYLSEDANHERMVVLSVLLKSDSNLYAKLGYDFFPFDEEKKHRIRFIVEMPEDGLAPNGDHADVYFSYSKIG